MLLCTFKLKGHLIIWVMVLWRKKSHAERLAENERIIQATVSTATPQGLAESKLRNPIVTFNIHTLLLVTNQ